MNTLISYVYRDDGNWKTYNDCVVKGEITKEQEEQIISCLENGTYFIPSRVHKYLPEDTFDSDYVPSDPWFEWNSCHLTNQEPDIDLTVEELVEAFDKMANEWKSVVNERNDEKKPYTVIVTKTISDKYIVYANDIFDACNEPQIVDSANTDLNKSENTKSIMDFTCIGIANADEVALLPKLGFRRE